MRRTLAMLVITIPLAIQAQSSEDMAYLPRHATAHTADHEGVGFSESAVPGSVDLVLPAGTDKMDLLNGRGDIVQVFEQQQLECLALDRLKPGTWTLRAHVGDHLLVRRFQVIGVGQVAWIPDQHEVRGRTRGR